MHRGIQLHVPRLVHPNVVEVVTPSTDLVYMGVLIRTLLPLTALVRILQEKQFTKTLLLWITDWCSFCLHGYLYLYIKIQARSIVFDGGGFIQKIKTSKTKKKRREKSFYWRREWDGWGSYTFNTFYFLKKWGGGGCWCYVPEINIFWKVWYYISLLFA